jgi:site-specific DNA-cytosine methylase
MKVLDLFSGLGGASEAFLTAGHDVVRIENNPLLSEVPNTQSMCVFELRDFLEANHETQNCDKEQIDLIWASPPCERVLIRLIQPLMLFIQENTQMNHMSRT